MRHSMLEDDDDGDNDDDVFTPTSITAPVVRPLAPNQGANDRNDSNYNLNKNSDKDLDRLGRYFSTPKNNNMLDDDDEIEDLDAYPKNFSSNYVSNWQTMQSGESEILSEAITDYHTNNDNRYNYRRNDADCIIDDDDGGNDDGDGYHHHDVNNRSHLWNGSIEEDEEDSDLDYTPQVKPLRSSRLRSSSDRKANNTISNNNSRKASSGHASLSKATSNGNDVASFTINDDSDDTEDLSEELLMEDFNETNDRQWQKPRPTPDDSVVLEDGNSLVNNSISVKNELKISDDESNDSIDINTSSDLSGIISSIDNYISTTKAVDSSKHPTDGTLTSKQDAKSTYMSGILKGFNDNPHRAGTGADIIKFSRYLRHDLQASDLANSILDIGTSSVSWRSLLLILKDYDVIDDVDIHVRDKQTLDDDVGCIQNANEGNDKNTIDCSNEVWHDNDDDDTDSIEAKHDEKSVKSSMLFALTTDDNDDVDDVDVDVDGDGDDLPIHTINTSINVDVIIKPVNSTTSNTAEISDAIGAATSITTTTSATTTSIAPNPLTESKGVDTDSDTTAIANDDDDDFVMVETDECMHISANCDTEGGAVIESLAVVSESAPVVVAAAEAAAVPESALDDKVADEHKVESMDINAFANDSHPIPATETTPPLLNQSPLPTPTTTASTSIPIQATGSYSYNYIRAVPLSEYAKLSGFIIDGWLERKSSLGFWLKRYFVLAESPKHFCELRIYKRAVSSLYGDIPLKLKSAIPLTQIESVDTSHTMSSQGREFTLVAIKDAYEKSVKAIFSHQSHNVISRNNSSSNNSSSISDGDATAAAMNSHNDTDSISSELEAGLTRNMVLRAIDSSTRSLWVSILKHATAMMFDD